MVKVIFKLNKRKDMWNWWHACKWSGWGIDWTDYMPKQVVRKIKGRTQKEAYRFLGPYLKRLYKKKRKEIDFFKSKIKSAWELKGKQIIKKLEEIHNKKTPYKKIICYYTSCLRAPYGFGKDYFWIAVPVYNFDSNIFLTTITHELFHLFFTYYYWIQCRKLGLKDELIGHLKEALTFLINSEFKGILLQKDYGYPIHKNLRKDLGKIWCKNKNFSRFIEKACRLIKEKYEKELLDVKK